MSGSTRWHRVPPRVAEAGTSTNESSKLQSDPSAQSPLVASIAIIGGGIAGLACAKRLGEHGVTATVFDTGKRGPGGRASSRVWNGHTVDHAVQFVCCTHSEFRNMIATCGSARPWGKDGRVGVLSESGFTPSEDGVDRWIGVDGFGSIVSSLANGLQIRQDVWVPPSHGIRCETNGSWSVAVPGKQGKKSFESFDAVVIAHNGKCAERLTSGIPAQEVHTLLRTNFAASLPRTPHAGAGKFTLNQVYSLLFEVPDGIMPNHFDAAFVENESRLRWLSCNTSKFRRNESKSQLQAWTVLSTALFGNQHKVPQEALEGTDKEVEVIGLLFQSVERALGLRNGCLCASVTATKLQLWGAALPINRWASKDGVDFAWSGAHKIGIAGDWLSTSAASASSVEAAWLSGTRLADHIASAIDSDAGIELGEKGGRFVPIDGDFGSGGSECPAWVAEASSNRASGKASSKGYAGKIGHTTAEGPREPYRAWGREGWNASNETKGKGKGWWKTDTVWSKDSGRSGWKGKGW